MTATETKPSTTRLKKGVSTIPVDSSGTIVVEPYRQRETDKLLARLTFVPRASHFESSGQDPFRGFYTLFWIGMFLFILRTFVTSFEDTGYPLSLGFATLFSKDALTLALSDGVLVGSTAACVPFMKLVKNGYIRYMGLGLVIQHVYQTLMLGIAVKWTFNRHWEWVQSGFFTLHCLVMMMKVHSYCSMNGHYSELYLKKQALESQLDKLVQSLAGGKEQAESDAAANRLHIKNSEPANSNASSQIHTPKSDQSFETEPGIGTPIPIPNGTVVGTVPGGSQLRKRLEARALETAGLETPNENGSSTLKIPATTSYFPPQAAKSLLVPPTESEVKAAHPLIDHPDEQLADLAQKIADLSAQLTSPGLGANGSGKVTFPENITLANFVDYQLIPTLVYELEYPRTEKIRPFYVFEKTVAFIGTFTLLYTITEHYIIPLTPSPDQNFFRSLLDLALPFMMSYLLLFYIIFECICNGFAELSRFADREFYEDWWNSTSQDEFARKWNKPVHAFLLRHVYASTISYHKLSKTSASLATFLLSSLVHELVMAIVTKKIRMYLFAMQMAQIPLIALGRLPFIRRNKVLGNVVFWVGLLTGLPLLCVAYCAY